MSANACYKGLHPKDKCVDHVRSGPCPSSMTPEERVDAFMRHNHPMLWAYSPGLFRRTLLDMIREAVRLSKHCDCCGKELRASGCNTCDNDE